MHLPAEAAATRCYDLNTAVWQDDWLRGEAGVVEGVGLGWGGAAQPHHRISRSTFKIQIFIRARNWSIPLIISPCLLPLICYSTAPISFHQCLFTSSILPSGRKKKSKGGSNAKRETENIKGQRERRAKHIHPFLIKAVAQKHFFSGGATWQSSTATTVVDSLAIPNLSRSSEFLSPLITHGMAASTITSLDSELPLSSPLCCSGI